MSVRQLRLDGLRDRLPQLLQQVRDHLGKLPMKRPSWPQNWPPQTVSVRWINWRMVMAAVLLGGIVHICAVFAASYYTGGHAYNVLVGRLPPNRMVVLPPQTAGRQILPELPADTLYAMCRYDLHQGAVAVRAAVLGPGWALSVHTPLGSNFYVFPGQAARSIDVSFLIVPIAPDAAAAIPTRDSSADAQIASPSLEGVVVLRGPIRGQAWTAETEAA